jgi:hypothetical protein
MTSVHEGAAIDDLLEAINALLRNNPAPTLNLDSCANSNQCGDMFLRSAGQSDVNRERFNNVNFDSNVSGPGSNKKDEVFLSAPRSRHVSVASPFWEQQAPYNTMTLPEVFKLLESDDDECIICVKKIHKLGFKSVKYLRQYFSLFGQVSRMVILPSRQKDQTFTPYYASAANAVRPASMCFVVMSTRWEASKILLQELHQIGDWPVEVSRFHRTSPLSSDVRTPSVASVETSCSPKSLSSL